ncbi:MAG TPA: GTPase Era [Candidatus Saccharimonadia bacterium]|nr:GTPase Era [Candidatus Saccharimonadia bacterium]
MPTREPFRSGTIAVLGRPNVGKSTLVNAMVGFKVSIVAPKPQTTRHRILGIATRDDAQYVFVDTPGLHAAGGRAINRYLNRAARGAVLDADVALLVLEAGRWIGEDDEALAVAAASRLPVVAALNKIDRVKDRATLLPELEQLAQRHGFAALVPISAAKRKGLDALERELRALLPERPGAFDPDAITDRSERFLATELIREQVVLQLRDELPHSTTVEIESFEEAGGEFRLEASIFVEREGQKAIVVGAGGAQIKKLGIAARHELEKLLGGKVHLMLHARVREKWSDDEAALRKFGYSE